MLCQYIFVRNASYILTIWNRGANSHIYEKLPKSVIH